LSKETSTIGRTAFVFGAVMVGLSIAQGFRTGFSFRLIALATVASAAGALLLFGVLSWLVRLGALRLAREGIHTSNRDPVQERSVQLTLAAAGSFDASLAAIKIIPGIKLLRDDKVAGEIGARTRMTWRSYGELVTIRLEPSDSGHTTVHIRSEPKGIQKVDYGKSVENVELIARELRRHV
jgi:hypothetical protein